jgi:hypothetical protein
LLYFQTPRATGFAHAGMLQASIDSYNNLKDTIVRVLDEHPGFSFVTTGHSLGAGVASLVAILFHIDYGTKYSVQSYAFACPSNVSPQISIAYRDVVTTIALDVDVVPRLCLGSVIQVRDQANKVASEREHNSIKSRYVQSTLTLRCCWCCWCWCCCC